MFKIEQALNIALKYMSEQNEPRIELEQGHRLLREIAEKMTELRNC